MRIAVETALVPAPARAGVDLRDGRGKATAAEELLLQDYAGREICGKLKGSKVGKQRRCRAAGDSHRGRACCWWSSPGGIFSHPRPALSERRGSRAWPTSRLPACQGAPPPLSAPAPPGGRGCMRYSSGGGAAGCWSVVTPSFGLTAGGRHRQLSAVVCTPFQPDSARLPDSASPNTGDLSSTAEQPAHRPATTRRASPPTPRDSIAPPVRLQQGIFSSAEADLEISLGPLEPFL